MTTIVQFPAPEARHARPAPEITITRQPVNRAADWQEAIAQECRRHRRLTPAVFAFLRTTGLLSRCTFLASEPGGPLTFRFIGVPTLTVLGTAWARGVLHQPDEADPHADFAAAIGEQYADAIESGDIVFNTIAVQGIGQGFRYTHMLAGWTEHGRRAVLSAVALH